VRRGDPRQAVVGGSGGGGGVLPRPWGCMHSGEGWIVRVRVKRHAWTIYTKASREQALAILRREASGPLSALDKLAWVPWRIPLWSDR
jgi:hypothetical protein